MFWEYSRSPTTSINPLFMLEIFLNSCQMSQRSSYNKAFLINLCQSFPLPFLSLSLSLSKDWPGEYLVLPPYRRWPQLHTVLADCCRVIGGTYTKCVLFSFLSLSFVCVCIDLSLLQVSSHYSYPVRQHHSGQSQGEEQRWRTHL